MCCSSRGKAIHNQERAGKECRRREGLRSHDGCVGLRSNIQGKRSRDRNEDTEGPPSKAEQSWSKRTREPKKERRREAC